MHEALQGRGQSVIGLAGVETVETVWKPCGNRVETVEKRVETVESLRGIILV